MKRTRGALFASGQVRGKGRCVCVCARARAAAYLNDFILVELSVRAPAHGIYEYPSSMA